MLRLILGSHPWGTEFDVYFFFFFSSILGSHQVDFVFLFIFKIFFA